MPSYEKPDIRLTVCQFLETDFYVQYNAHYLPGIICQLSIYVFIRVLAVPLYLFIFVWKAGNC